MVDFGSIAELAAFLGKLHPDYAQHALAVWQEGIRNTQQFADLSEPFYLACGVQREHVDNIKRNGTDVETLPRVNEKARAHVTGQQLADRKLFQHHSGTTLSALTHNNQASCAVSA